MPLGRVRHDDPVSRQRLHAQQVLRALRVLDAADVLEVRELGDQLGGHRVAGVHRVEEEHRQGRGARERLVPRADGLRRRARRVVRVHRDAEVDAVLDRVLAQLDRVREDVMAHLCHDRHAPGGLSRHELVHPLPFVERQGPELAHHAAAEDAVHAQPVDVVVDGTGKRILVDLPAVRGERSGDRDPEARDLLAGQLLG